jgi:hypothetical protein
MEVIMEMKAGDNNFTVMILAGSSIFIRVLVISLMVIEAIPVTY